MSASAPPAPTDIPTTATTLIADGGGFVLAEHLPALIVLVPLFGSVITAALRRSAPSYVVTLIVAWALPVLSLLTLQRVIAEGTLSYAMGGWAPPFGIELRVDEAGAFLAVLISIMAALVVSYAPRSLAAEIHPAQRGWYYTMLLLCMGGLLGMALSGDAFNIFVFMEISSLAMYTLIAMGRDRRALVAAFQYLVLGTLGATFYVIGVGLLFTLTGTLNLADIAAEIGPVAD
ncbi:MAG: proton-conducting transporter membrane subunit, partial [Pseudomonadota bacterium]